MPRRTWRTGANLRRRLYGILEHGTIGDRAAVIVGRLIVILIVVNLVAMTLDSVPALQAQYGPLFLAIELLSLVLFTIEYVLRVWVAAEHAPYRHASERRARWKFVSSPFGCFVILLGATLVAASIMHVIEGHVQPDKFGTIPDAMWWAIVTLGTIGYGDVVPVTALGRVVASITIFAGLIMVALPIGIVATAFADEVHRRDFVVTWGMVARVPLFAELQATEIADIMRLLHAQQVEVGDVIVRRGEPAHSMYFIAAGDVEIELKHERVRLGAGHFFGEVAALHRTRRSATVTAVTRTSLLVLDAHDLHVLMDREPRIAEHIREVARARVGGDMVTRTGDLVVEELDEAETIPQSADSRSRS